MLSKKLNDSPEFLAADKTRLREVLHPNNDKIGIGYSLAHAYLKVGEASLPHRLKGSETYYILAGKGRIHINQKSREVTKDAVIFVPPNANQHIENIGSEPLCFLCIVEPFWRAEDEQV